MEPDDDWPRRVMGAADGAKIAFARSQRRDPSSPESVLWEALRGGKLGAKFRRQHPVDEFIPDFYCEALRLAIEVDGKQHDATEAYDDWRDRRLLSVYGITTVRIAAAVVSKETGQALYLVRAAIDDARHSLDLDAPSC